MCSLNMFPERQTCSALARIRIRRIAAASVVLFRWAGADPGERRGSGALCGRRCSPPRTLPGRYHSHQPEQSAAFAFALRSDPAPQQMRAVI